jgi:hypothetical protein
LSSDLTDIHRVKPEVTPACAAWVKGKIERPYSFIREGFRRGYGFIGLETANRDLLSWLCKKDERVHGTTHEVVQARFCREKPHLNMLPPRAFDTSYRIYRKVYKDCTVRFEGNSYVVAHDLVGNQIILRVKGSTIRIFHNDCLVITYDISEGKGHLVQDKRFYEALRKDREMNKQWTLSIFFSYHRCLSILFFLYTSSQPTLPLNFHT